MTETPPDAAPDLDELNILAGKYLNLWVEHWAAAMAAPETAAAMARLFTTPTMPSGAGFDLFAAWPRTGTQPSSVRTAPDIGDGRVDQLERRIAALEQRLAERDTRPASDAPTQPAVGRTAGKPGRRSSKV